MSCKMKDDIKYVENKLHRGKLFLDKNSLLTLSYSRMHTYLNYANLSLGSANRINLKKLRNQQKRAIPIINNRTRFGYTNVFFKSQKY